MLSRPAVLLLLPLLAVGTVFCVPAELPEPEGSGEHAPLTVAEPEPEPGLQTLETAASDIEQTERKDELFNSLADLLSRQDQALPEPEQLQEEPAVEPWSTMEQESEQKPALEKEPKQESEQDPEQAEEQEPEQGLGQVEGLVQEADTTSETVVVPVRLTGVPVVPTLPGDEAPEEAGPGADQPPADVPLSANEVPLPAPGRQPVQEPVIVAETAPCLGCVTPILHDGADLRRVANMASKLLEERLDARFSFRVTEVYRASKQIVNGIKYFLTLELASTSCERPVPPFTLCYVGEDAEKVIYSVEMLHQPHRANTELISLRKPARLP
ncbi:protein TsetseEP-like [Pollicipes pollicipes]|uniref:protein TsetseEP-like n=1 Tax=Pollicipes pollicipes TaxID=41117 RepID=UPI001885390F|nr:protein TsetseEP-like [Pollicipes pollicipes]